MSFIYVYLCELCFNLISFLFYSTDNAKDKCVMTGSQFRSSTVLLDHTCFHNQIFIIVFKDILQSCLNLPLLSLYYIYMCINKRF